MCGKFVTVFVVALFALHVLSEEKKEAPKNDYGPVIGIDLGTTYSCVGLSRNGRIEIISNDQGNRITPSYVAFSADGQRLIGDAAKNQLTTNPENTIFDAKRIIGRTWEDDNLKEDVKHFPFTVINKDNKPLIEVTANGVKKSFAPEEVSAMVLTKMKTIAEEYLGQNVTHAVVTVPAYFSDAQRQATKNAGVIAGIKILRILNEPTAAAIAYGLDKKKSGEDTDKKESQILVFDLGGGTFDVSLLAIDHGVFEVIATSGNTHLGGEDFDQRVVTYFVEVYKKKKGKNIKSNTRSLQKLRREVEKAKRALSTVHSTKIEVESIIDGEDFSETLTRAKFEELNSDLFKSTLDPVRQVLKDAKLEKSAIDEIVLVGGSTRIPRVQQLVREFFDNREVNTGINPDEAIAYGAAVQASVLAGDSSAGDLLLLDVCPLTLGMELEGGTMAKLIPRNTPIPTIKRDTFTTIVDNQDKVVTSVYEGERVLVKDNHFLGQFDLTGLPPAPRGVPQIEVTFEIDANGILKVSAEDLANKNKKEIVIQNDKSRLNDADIEKMIQDAEKYKQQDEEIRVRREALNELEHYVYSIRQQVRNPESAANKKLTTSQITKLTNIVEDAITWIDNNKSDTAGKTKSDYDAKRKEVESEVQPIMAKLYAENKEHKDNKKDEL